MMTRLMVAAAVLSGLLVVSATGDQRQESRQGTEDSQGTEIDGTWNLTKYIENGKPNETEVRAKYRII